jgi:hypothetical protein
MATTRFTDSPLTDGVQRFDIDTIRTTLNKAVDDVTAHTEPNDNEFLTDLTNLIVNAGLHYLEHPDTDLNDVLEAEYDADDIRAIKDEISGGSW